MKDIILCKQAARIINKFPISVRQRYVELITLLQSNQVLPPKDFKVMNTIAIGTYEMRIKKASGAYRIFYYLKHKKGIIVFHAFTKKTQKTPKGEIDIARRRLKNILEELNG